MTSNSQPEADTRLDITGVILAAGASSRLGRPKQLLRRGGLTLLERVTREVLGAELSRVLVVLGAHAGQIRPCLAELPVQVAFNPEWREGLGASIRCAVEWAGRRAPETAGLLFVAADQALLSSSGLRRIVCEFERGVEGIVVARYAGTRGIPALFGRPFFQELEALEGDRGAQSVLERHSGRITEVPLEEAAIDIDRWEDWESLHSSDKMQP